MTDFKKLNQEYFDNYQDESSDQNRIFYKESEKNLLVSDKIQKDETLQKYFEFINTFRPAIIAKDPSTFCFFGTAKSRYENSIYNIINYYPFDGSQKEVVNWLSSSSTLDLAIIEKHWPSSTGHIKFNNKQYINFFGGPGKITGAEYTGNLQKGETPLKIDYVKGNTVEFWLKKSDWIGGAGSTETVFQVGSHPAHVNDKRASFRVILARQNSDAGSPFFIEYLSGSTAASNGMILTSIGGTDRNHDAYIDGKWHHYAFRVFQSASSPPNTDLQSIYADMFMDGKKIHSLEQPMGAGSVPLLSQDSFMAGTIGARLNSSQGTLTGSIDEFRFWKGQRTNREINRYYDQKVYASEVDTEEDQDSYTSRLGVYYKFNKKIINNSESDSLILDYSGNEMFAKISRYTTNTRDSQSAISQSTASLNLETPDLSLLESDPSIASLREELSKIAKSYDSTNHSSLIKMIPSWAHDPYGNVESNEKSDFYILMNMIAEEFDEIKLNIDSIRLLSNRNFDSNYVSLGESGKEISSPISQNQIGRFDCSDSLTELDIYPGNRLDFPQRNLEKLGFTISKQPLDLNVKPEDQFENIIGNVKLSLDPSTTKKLILDNVLIAATSILKKKGTERSFDELLSCWGVDRKLISINVYGQNSELEISKKNKNIETSKIKSFDFSQSPETTFFMSAPRFDVVSNSPATADSIRRIAKSNITDKTPDSNITIEGNFIFPKINEESTLDLETSVFGLRAINASAEDYSVYSFDNSNQHSWFQINTVRTNAASADAKFVLRSPLASGDIIESPVISEVFNNTKWNLSLKIERAGTVPFGAPGNPTSQFLSSSAGNVYQAVFSGYNYILDSLQNSFKETIQLTQDQYDKFIQSDRTVFVGAERNNINGSTVNYKSNVKFLNMKAWNASLDDSEIKNLSKNIFYWGHSSSSFYNTGFVEEVLQDSTIQSQKSKNLIFKINMSEHTSVPSNGIVQIKDFTSGSVDSRKSKYGTVLGSKYPFSSTVIPESNRDKVIQQEFIRVMKDQPLELIRANDEVLLKKTDLGKFDINSKEESRIISFEKSIYNQISKEMIDFLSGIKSFNNIIGEPVNKYRTNYKLMNHFRSVFFENVENENQFERYVEYYRWIDHSLGSLLQQLVPATAQTNTKLQNVIESHILERNKYQYKFPLLKNKIVEYTTVFENIGNSLSWSMDNAGTCPEGQIRNPDGTCSGD